MLVSATQKVTVDVSEKECLDSLRRAIIRKFNVPENAYIFEHYWCTNDGVCCGGEIPNKHRLATVHENDIYNALITLKSYILTS